MTHSLYSITTCLQKRMSKFFFCTFQNKSAHWVRVAGCITYVKKAEMIFFPNLNYHTNPLMLNWLELLVLMGKEIY